MRRIVCIFEAVPHSLSDQLTSHFDFIQSVIQNLNLKYVINILHSNFKSRNDGNQKTMNFLASPSIVTAMAFSGKLSFNPVTDTIVTPSGKEFKFKAPVGKTLPAQGFEAGWLLLSFSIRQPSNFVQAIQIFTQSQIQNHNPKYLSSFPPHHQDWRSLSHSNLTLPMVSQPSYQQ
jgi:aconitase A